MLVYQHSQRTEWWYLYCSQAQHEQDSGMQGWPTHRRLQKLTLWDRLAESQTFTAAHIPRVTQNMHIHRPTKCSHGCLIIPCYLQSKIRRQVICQSKTQESGVWRAPFISCACSLLITVLRAVRAVPNVNRIQTQGPKQKTAFLNFLHYWVLFTFTSKTWFSKKNWSSFFLTKSSLFLFNTKPLSFPFSPSTCSTRRIEGPLMG